MHFSQYANAICTFNGSGRAARTECCSAVSGSALLTRTLFSCQNKGDSQCQRDTQAKSALPRPPATARGSRFLSQIPALYFSWVELRFDQRRSNPSTLPAKAMDGTHTWVVFG